MITTRKWVYLTSGDLPPFSLPSTAFAHSLRSIRLTLFSTRSPRCPRRWAWSLCLVQWRFLRLCWCNHTTRSPFYVSEEHIARWQFVTTAACVTILGAGSPLIPAERWMILFTSCAPLRVSSPWPVGSGKLTWLYILESDDLCVYVCVIVLSTL